MNALKIALSLLIGLAVGVVGGRWLWPAEPIIDRQVVTVYYEKPQAGPSTYRSVTVRIPNLVFAPVDTVTVTETKIVKVGPDSTELQVARDATLLRPGLVGAGERPGHRRPPPAVGLDEGKSTDAGRARPDSKNPVGDRSAGRVRRGTQAGCEAVPLYWSRRILQYNQVVTIKNSRNEKVDFDCPDRGRDSADRIVAYQ